MLRWAGRLGFPDQKRLGTLLTEPCPNPYGRYRFRHVGAVYLLVTFLDLDRWLIFSSAKYATARRRGVRRREFWMPSRIERGSRPGPTRQSHSPAAARHDRPREDLLRTTECGLTAFSNGIAIGRNRFGEVSHRSNPRPAQSELDMLWRLRLVQAALTPEGATARRCVRSPSKTASTGDTSTTPIPHTNSASRSSSRAQPSANRAWLRTRIEARSGRSCEACAITIFSAAHTRLKSARSERKY